MTAMNRMKQRLLAAATSVAVGLAFAALPMQFDLAAGSFAKPAFAKKGADDGPNHDVNDDNGGERGNKSGKGRGGADDGPNHDVNDDKGGQRGNKGGKGRGGADDGPNHT